jgi:phosphoglycolate phosphatase
MQFDTLVFDLDGTLSDPKLGVVRCMNFALTSFDYSPLPDQEIAQYIGPPLEEIIQRLTGSNDENHIDTVVAKYRERYFELGFTENKLYPEIPEMLSSLAERNIRMGVCTSKHLHVAEKIVESFGLSQYFDFISGPTSKMIKAKQLEGLLAANTISKNAIMIGDRAVDLIAANANGLAKAGVLWGYGDEEELRPEKPNFLFRNPAELAAAFIEA